VAAPRGQGAGGSRRRLRPAASISGAHDDRFAGLIASTSIEAAVILGIVTAAIAVVFAVTLVPAGKPAGGEPAGGEPAGGAPGSPVSLPTQPERPGAP